MADISSSINNGSNKTSKFFTIINDNKDMKINSHIEEIDPSERTPRSFDKYKEKINNGLEIMEFTDTGTRNDIDIAPYLDTLIENDEIDLAAGERDEILALEPEEALKYIKELKEEKIIETGLNVLYQIGIIDNDDYDRISILDYSEAITEISKLKSKYYSDTIGLPITDELIEILKNPNAEEDGSFANYLNEQLKNTSDFKKKYVDYQLKANGLALSQYERIELYNNFNTIEEINQYIAEHVVEAMYRNQAYEEFDQYCQMNYGCHTDELEDYITNISDSNTIRNELNEYCQEKYGCNFDELGANQRNVVDEFCQEKYKCKADDFESYVEKVMQTLNNINKRIDFLLEIHEIETSGVLDEINIYGNIDDQTQNKYAGDGSGEFYDYYMQYPGIGTLISYENSKIKYLDYNNEYHYIDINELNMLYGTSLLLKKGNNELGDASTEVTSSEGQQNLIKDYNTISITKYYLECKKDMSDPRKALFAEMFEKTNVGQQILYSRAGTSEQFNIIDLVSIMDDKQIKTYNYLFEKYGYEKAEEYLANLILDPDIQSRLTTELAMQTIGQFANITKVDYRELEELTYDEVAELESNGSILIDIDANGEIRYYKGKEGYIYLQTEENGKIANYQVEPNDSWANLLTIFNEGSLSGFENFFKGIGRCFEETDGTFTVREQAKMIVQQAVEIYNYGKITYNVGSGVGAAIPKMVISCIPGGSYVSMVLNAMSTYGNTQFETKRQVMNSGGVATDSEIKIYAALTAGLDTAIDVLTRGIPGYSKTVGGLDAKLSQYFLYSVVKSGAGAAFGYVEDKGLRSLLLHEDFRENFSWEEMGEQALTAMITTGILNAYKIPKNAKTIVGNMVDKHEAIGTIENEYDISRKDAKKVYKLKGKYNIDDDTSMALVKIMNAANCKEEDAISLYKTQKVLGLSLDDLVDNKDNIYQKYNISPQDIDGIYAYYQLKGMEIPNELSELIKLGYTPDGAINYIKLKEKYDLESAKNEFNNLQNEIDVELAKPENERNQAKLMELQTIKNDLNHIFHLEENFKLEDSSKGASKRFGERITLSQETENYINNFRNKERSPREITIGDKTFTTDLTDEELVKFAQDYWYFKTDENGNHLVQTIEDFAKYCSGDGVPRSADFIAITDEGKMTVAWGENDGAIYGLNDSTNEITVGNYITRVGNPNGINVCMFGTIEEVNATYSRAAGTRGLPWCEGSFAESRWIVTKDINVENIVEDLKTLQVDDPELYNKIMNQVSKDLYGGKKVATLDDIKCLTGVVAPDFGTQGAETQYTLPIRTGYLEQLGYLINPEDLTYIKNITGFSDADAIEVNNIKKQYNFDNFEDAAYIYHISKAYNFKVEDIMAAKELAKEYNIPLEIAVNVKNKNNFSIKGINQYYRYSNVYDNPDYYDIATGKIIYPPFEGSSQYVGKFSDYDDFYDYCSTKGVEGLISLGATEVTLSELENNGSLTRGTWNNDINKDVNGEYFGGASITGVNDVKHRVLGPSTEFEILYRGGHTYYLDATSNAYGSLILPEVYRANEDTALSNIRLVVENGSIKGYDSDNNTYYVRCLKTTTADWFDQEGGAEQYLFYLTDNKGRILRDKYGSNYKLNVSNLKDLGIITSVHP